ncbi:MAG: CTP synthase [Nitrososphaerales archaeon]
MQEHDRKRNTPAPKYIFITGGVMSGLGKGVTSASLAKLLMLAGFKVICAKIDPYLNVDAGTMNPVTHGEVFVTDDGGETDMDLGTYERFLDMSLSRDQNITTGQIYSAVIESERKGKYLGSCVQIIPHITDEIRRRIKSLHDTVGTELVLVELGGTVGDIEGLPFLEAFRQIRFEAGDKQTLFVHVTLIPQIGEIGEQKTKPTQHSVQELRRIGIQPDIIVARSEQEVTEAVKRKISQFTNVDWRHVISNPDVESIYRVPEILGGQEVVQRIAEKLELRRSSIRWGSWPSISSSFVKVKNELKIVMVGKYVSLSDSYVSVNHSLAHAAAHLGYRVNTDWIDAERFESNPRSLSTLEQYNGIVVPGGFGRRAAEGIIRVADYARVKDIPFLGLCFGFQLATISFARNVCSLAGANSTELDETVKYPVVDLLPDQKEISDLGATMNLGGHNIRLLEKTAAHKIYGKKIVRQRHRHRYEINPEFWDVLQLNGLVFSGFSEDGKKVEIIELDNHSFYLATQYHPEFISRPGKPEPSFLGFIQGSISNGKLRHN